jgi:hypothetical protein
MGAVSFPPGWPSALGGAVVWVSAPGTGLTPMESQIDSLYE